MSDQRWGDLLVAGDDRRREIRARGANGIDAVEVAEDGRRLVVLFLARVPEGLTRHNVRIDRPTGARRVQPVSVRRSAGADPELEDRLIVELDHPGSAGRYRLRLVEPGPDGRAGFEPHRETDPRFAQAAFVFDVDAPLPPIMRGAHGTPPSAEGISYLSRDYEGLRQLMLDRLSVTLPTFTERHIPDLWITLVELLAYAGDDLSYYEDAVATEAYLQTARRRISIRRHARLLGYRLHNGCSARAWVCVKVTRELDLPLGQVRFAAAGALAEGSPLIEAMPVAPAFLAALEQYSPLPAVLPASRSGASAPVAGGQESEPTLALRPAHNEIPLWSWGESDTRLLVGATSAVLKDGKSASRILSLAPGDVLVLEETGQPEPPPHGLGPPVLGPRDPAHRHAVRLTAVRELTDPLYDQPLLEVHWPHEDALTFELAVTVAGQAACCALGNVVLVSHGVVSQELILLDDAGNATLTEPGVSFSTQFPDPELVGVHQARALRGLYEAWRIDLERHREAAVHGTRLSERAREELRAQLGEHELAWLGISGEGEGEGDGDGGYDDAADQAARDADGLAELLATADRLLARRCRRLRTLATLAEASGQLGAVLIAELVDDWGPRLAAPLVPSTPGGWGPAACATEQDPRSALPIAMLTAESTGWQPAVDLIGVAPDERAFLTEVDDEGIARLRVNAPPPQSSPLRAVYAVGNGLAGNVVADAINAIVWTGGSPPGAGNDGAAQAVRAAVSGVRNPLPASGGLEPEDPADARLAIPGSFEDRQPRALTAEDYAQLATLLPGVRRAAAELRFTGSVTIADVAVQPELGEDPHPALLGSVQLALGRVRRVGHAVRTHAPRFRPLVIELSVGLEADTIRAVAADQLASLMSAGWLPDGRPALFHPERLGFGQSVFASAVIAAAQGIGGVTSVALAQFSFLADQEPRRAGAPPVALHVGAMEIIRLDNDPARPQNGHVVVSLRGGR